MTSDEYDEDEARESDGNDNEYENESIQTIDDKSIQISIPQPMNVSSNVQTAEDD